MKEYVGMRRAVGVRRTTGVRTMVVRKVMLRGEFGVQKSMGMAGLNILRA